MITEKKIWREVNEKERREYLVSSRRKSNKPAVGKAKP